MKVKRYKHNNATIPKIKGVTISGDFVEFDNTFSEKDIAFLRGKVKSGIGSVEFVSPSKSFDPTDSDREKIKSHVRNADIASFGIYQAIAAKNMMIDRDGDILERDFLEIMAQRYKEGRSMVDSHNRQQRIGKTFDAEVITNEKGQAELLVKFYIPDEAKMLSGNSAKMEIDTGMVENVSVSFLAPEDSLTFVKADDSSNTYGVPHFRYHAPKKSPMESVEVFELSMVTMGAQQGARVKSADQKSIANSLNENARTFGSQIDKNKSPEMEFIEKKIDRYKLKVAESSADSFDSLADYVAELEKMVSDQDKEISDKKLTIEELNKKLGNDKDAKINDLINLKKQILGEEAISAETEKAALKELPYDFVIAQINQMQDIAKIKQLNPGEEGGEGDQEQREGGSEPKAGTFKITI